MEREDPSPGTAPSVNENAETLRLREVEARSFPGRLLGYARLSGPGWVQSAITLGASTATSCFYLGWKFQYGMLWVNVLGMAMGVVMFAAVAGQVLRRGESLYRAVWKHVHPSVALAWALAAIVSSIFWCMNQYAAAAACLSDIGQAAGWIGSEAGLLRAKWGIGAVILAASIPLTWAYGTGRGAGVRLYEWVLKGMIFFMVLCFAAVALKTGIRWGDAALGLLPLRFPDDAEDWTLVLGALGCTVGINMTFLFPISLRARGWGRRHVGLARFDLAGGMLIPFAVISSLVIITAANVLPAGNPEPSGPTAVSQMMDPLFAGSPLPESTGRVVFDLGVAAMPLSTITILMLISGLAVCEVLGKPHRGFWFRAGSLLPAVGILGVGYKAPFYLGPLISSFALILLPIAYIAFLVLNNRRAFLGEDTPVGGKRLAWNIALGLVAAVTLTGAAIKVKGALDAFLGT